MEIVDGGEKKLRCANCAKPLLNYRTFTNDDIVRSIICECPFCGGHSLKTKIKGRFFYGPIGTDQNTEPTIVEIVDVDKSGTEFNLVALRRNKCRE